MATVVHNTVTIGIFELKEIVSDNKELVNFIDLYDCFTITCTLIEEGYKFKVFIVSPNKKLADLSYIYKNGDGKTSIDDHENFQVFSFIGYDYDVFCRWSGLELIGQICDRLADYLNDL